MILAVDLGNYGIKTSEDVQFISTFAEFDGVDPNETKVIRYEGKDYVMELKGSFDNEFNKTKKNYMPNLLWAIEKSVPSEVSNIKLVLGIPVENMGAISKYKEDLEGKEFTFEVKNKKPRTIKIEKVAIVAEGVSSFYMLSEKERLNDVLLIDVGGRTTNVVTFKNQRIEHKKQVNKGMINYYEEVTSKFNSTGENVKTEDIKNLIDREIVPAEIVNNLQAGLVKYIFNEIKTVCNKDYYKIWFTGGGSIELIDTIKSIESKSNFMENAVFTNSKGNKKIAQVQWRD